MWTAACVRLHCSERRNCLMAVVQTYASLQADVIRYLERGTTAAMDPLFTEELPRLINLAENRIATELKVLGFIEVVTGTMEVGLSVYPKPDRWRQTVSMNIGTGTGNNSRTFLLTRSYEYCRSYWPDSTETEQPLFYADYNYNNWLISPTPDVAYPFEVVYYQLLPLLSDEVQTNWLTENYPQLLLYATLMEASPFLKNDERIATWQALYDRAAGMVNGEDLAKILDRSATRKAA